MSNTGNGELLKDLLLTGSYSDLKLVCHGQQFNVHKNVVCAQSKVLAAACKGEFEESRTNVINAEVFEPETVRRMINFLYTKTYEVKLSEGQVKNLGQTSGTKFTNGDGGYIPIKYVAGYQRPQAKQIKKGQMAAIILCHVEVNAIADYYDIPSLRDLANDNIKYILKCQWEVEKFSEIIAHSIQSTTDPNLHDLLASTTAEHIQELLTIPDLGDSHVSSEFYMAIIMHTGRRIGELQSQLMTKDVKISGVQDENRRIDERRKLLETEKMKAAELQTSIDNMIEAFKDRCSGSAYTYHVIEFVGNNEKNGSGL
ncbi:uncharacterized protein GIQ15_06485 [Arthroderma uncinatum]|uniref:uncharacterized protein n=1 Tax=Arthroderma uncinatum TaxID=74035 RepID=UPI00144A8E85|nr:uncharacterized protein GIQ15_06485 [Arthroderma uncinatum]KAF3479509.1 hypothetical protein GIQ15_06485 [Arthroderma uncinatum]